MMSAYAALSFRVARQDCGSRRAPPTLEDQKAIAFLKSDPQMRAVFINKVAPPIANKMFDCGMIP
jgi:hypothetical protein